MTCDRLIKMGALKTSLHPYATVDYNPHHFITIHSTNIVKMSAAISHSCYIFNHLQNSVLHIFIFIFSILNIVGRIVGGRHSNCCFHIEGLESSSTVLC